MRNWAAAYLIKQAALWSPAKTVISKTTGKPRTMELNWELAKNRARLDPNVRLVTPETIKSMPWHKRVIGRLLNWAQPAHTIPVGSRNVISVNTASKNKALDLTRPGASSETLSHELDEASLRNPRRETRLLNLTPENERVVRADIENLAKPGILRIPSKLMSLWRIRKTIAKGGVGHVDPITLYRESNRIAAGEVSPEHAATMIALRKMTGEYQALKRLGVAYGQQVIPEGGRAWNRLLARQQRMMPLQNVDDAISMYNLYDLRRNLRRTGPFSNISWGNNAELKQKIMEAVMQRKDFDPDTKKGLLAVLETGGDVKMNQQLVQPGRVLTPQEILDNYKRNRAQFRAKLVKHLGQRGFKPADLPREDTQVWGRPEDLGPDRAYQAYLAEQEQLT